MKRNNIRLTKWENMHKSFYERSMEHIVEKNSPWAGGKWPRETWPVSNLSIRRIKLAIQWPEFYTRWV